MILNLKFARLLFFYHDQTVLCPLTGLNRRYLRYKNFGIPRFRANGKVEFGLHKTK